MNNTLENNKINATYLPGLLTLAGFFMVVVIMSTKLLPIIILEIL